MQADALCTYIHIGGYSTGNYHSYKYYIIYVRPRQEQTLTIVKST